MSASIDCFGATDPGRVRENNEDHFVVAGMRKQVTVLNTSLDRPDLEGRFGGEQAFLLAVADGVGGRPGGEFASSQVVQGLLRYMSQAAGCFNKFDVNQEHEFLEQLEQEIRSTHQAILEQHGDDSRAPATTLTLSIVVGVRAYLVHVGDSRAYHFRRGKLRQMTRDQTIGEFMVNIGAWTDTQAARSPTAGALASAIGGSELSPVVGLVDLEPGDGLLLCTDGLTRHVTDDAIAAVLREATGAQPAAEELVRRALAAGGEDNVTVVVARVPG